MIPQLTPKLLCAGSHLRHNTLTVFEQTPNAHYAAFAVVRRTGCLGKDNWGRVGHMANARGIGIMTMVVSLNIETEDKGPQVRLTQSPVPDQSDPIPCDFGRRWRRGS